jgi:YD repeat-containing protein
MIPLGRLTSVVQPGDSQANPTASYTYINTCTSGATAPCLELDTTTRVTSGSNTATTTKQWYDGMGRLVETQSPGPNQLSKLPALGSMLVTYTIYDNMGHATTQSLPYAIAASATVHYAIPDLNQARTVSTFDGMGRPLGSVSYGIGVAILSESTISYTVGQGLPSFTVDTSTPFEQTITLDAYNHQQMTYTDALGRTRYGQVFSGTGSPYTVVRTVQYNRDEVGNLLSTITFDASSKAQATRSSIYDGLQRVIGWNDSDEGSCTNIPMPASCSNSSDTARKVTYDADGNVLSQTDPRNVSTYTSYDALDRPLCRGTASSQVNPCQSSAYATFFYDSYDNNSNPGVTFPSDCRAPGGTSDLVGGKIAEEFSSSAGNGWRCYGYDARGQTIASTLSVTADGHTTTQNVSVIYNDLGDVTNLTYPDGETVTSQYDSNGRLRSAYFGTSSSSDPVAFLAGQVSYLNSGQLAGLAIGGTANKTSAPTSIFSTSLSYDGMQRPVSSSATRTGASSPFWSQQRTFDNAGNILQLSTMLPTVSGGSSKTDDQSFCYDALDRLTWAGNTGTPSGGDHCGLAPTGSTTSGYSQSFSYDELDRMTSGSAGTESYSDPSHVHAATGLSSVTNPYASYDAMGNMTCRNVSCTRHRSNSRM